MASRVSRPPNRKTTWTTANRANRTSTARSTTNASVEPDRRLVAAAAGGAAAGEPSPGGAAAGEPSAGVTGVAGVAGASVTGIHPAGEGAGGGDGLRSTPATYRPVPARFAAPAAIAIGPAMSAAA